MNNNMSNNFNNGTPNNGNNTFNNGIANSAKEQLVGGQSAVGNGPSVMQGMPNVQNNPGMMQGVGNVPNSPNVMQGNSVSNQTPTNNPVMPGQNHSGVNAFTMQKEEPKQTSPEVVSIPNFAPNIPEKPKQPAPQPNVMQTPNPMPGVTPNMNNINNNNNIVNNIPMPNVPNQNTISNNPLNSAINNPTPQAENNQINVPNVMEPKVNTQNPSPINMGGPIEPNKPITPTVPGLGNNVANQPINQAPNTLGQVNNQNLNSFPYDNINQMNGPKPQNSIGVTSPMTNNMNANGGINSMNSEPKDLNDSIPSVNNGNFNSGVSQVGQTEMNSMDNDIVEMPEAPEKKFPLSVREMVLIGVALVGIIAVVIMYWPK